MKIDCQTHIMPEAYVDIFTRNTRSPRMEKDRDGTVITIVNERPLLRSDLSNYDINKKIKDMDALGIDISILSPNIPGPCMLASELALQGAQTINNFIAEVIEQYPDRFAGIASLPWQNPQEAVDEMNRAADHLGLCAVMLFSNIGGRPVDAPEYEPIFALAESKGLSIVIHPTFPVWGDVMRDYMMIPMIGFQMDSSLALLRLILGGVLERHPDLKIVMPHAGGILPYMIGRIDYQTEEMGRKPEHIVQAPSVYLKRVFLDTCSPSVEAVQYACDFTGPEHIVFGTDHPWVDPKIFFDIVDRLKISDSERSLIFSDNAKKLFHIGA